MTPTLIYCSHSGHYAKDNNVPKVSTFLLGMIVGQNDRPVNGFTSPCVFTSSTHSLSTPVLQVFVTIFLGGFVLKSTEPSRHCTTLRCQYPTRKSVFTSSLRSH